MIRDEMLTVGSFDELIASRMLAENTALASRWLERLVAVLPTDAGDVFPGKGLLDHIPTLVAEIAEYIIAPEAEEIAANTAVIDKARELGLLRHEQKVSIHQLLREYELLAEILAAFLSEETAAIGLQPRAADVLRVARRIDRAARSLMRVTVETFVGEYARTLEEHQRRLDNFRHMFSHELRNPIGTLAFAARLLAADLADDPGSRSARAVDAIQRNVEHLTVLINSLQRINGDVLAGGGPTEQLVELAVIARDVARQLRQMADARGVAVLVGDDLPITVSDPARLELILMNLVANGIKYSDPSKPARTVDIRSLATPPASWGFSVADNGLGIPDEALPLVFERFTRAHADRDPELGIDGSGLGLAIVKDAIDAMNGTIVCRSTVGVGTVFEIRLPKRDGVPED